MACEGNVLVNGTVGAAMEVESVMEGTPVETAIVDVAGVPDACGRARAPEATTWRLKRSLTLRILLANVRVQLQAGWASSFSALWIAPLWSAYGALHGPGTSYNTDGLVTVFQSGPPFAARV